MNSSPIVVFWQPDFPNVDSLPTTRADWEAIGARCVGVDDLAAALAAGPALFVHPFGSTFPREAWPAFLAYLQRGGRWLNLGAPLAHPVRRGADGGWIVPAPQRTLARRLLLNQAYPVDLASDAVLAVTDPAIALPPVSRAWALQVRFTKTPLIPEELGSQGLREAHLHPVVRALVAGRHVVSPVVEIERVAGEFAGGRWLLAACTGEAPVPRETLAALVARALRPRLAVRLAVDRTCVSPGASIAIRAEREPGTTGPLAVEILRDEAPLARVPWDDAGEFTTEFRCPQSGLHRVVVRTAAGETIAERGFWGRDEALLDAQPPISTTRDYFLRGGRPFPITGTTYTCDVAQREFLADPHPEVWDRDLAAIKASGVNLVRIGVWTGWGTLSDETGEPREDVLCAWEAWMHAAARHGLPLIFTFFSFTPPVWGGTNPYLCPRAIAAQERFVAAFVRRAGGRGWVLWDFINEPSFASPLRLWVTRPNGDAVEADRWAAWLRGTGVSDGERLECWQSAEDGFDVPGEDDFGVGQIPSEKGRRPHRANDYLRFAQEGFNSWLGRMVAVVRANGGAAQLLTVGQDEGGLEARPSPHFHAGLIDFTSNHNWWNVDDLLWDTVGTKTRHRPHLIEESGVMFVEGLDGLAWRSPRRAANLLERKLVLSFAGGGAGFVQWLWNTNVFLDSDNEVGIGLHWAGGAEKPEVAVVRDIAAFFAAHADRFRDRELEAACVILPQSSLLSVRPLGGAAAARAVRLLEYHLGIPCRVVGEYQAPDADGARLLVLPSARVLDETCWRELRAQVERGATLLVTGGIDADPWWRPASRLAEFLGPVEFTPVHREEVTRLGALTVHATFAGDRHHLVDKAASADGAVIPFGQGRIVFCPLPVELAQAESQAVPLYRFAADLAGLRVHESVHPGLLIREVALADATLYLVVNESSAAVNLGETSAGRGWGDALRVPADRSLIALVDRSDRRLLGVYEPKD